MNKQDEQMLKNIRIAAEIVYIEDKELLEELGKESVGIKRK